MLPRTYFFICFLLFTGFLAGQNSWLPGEVTLMDGSTITGTIQNRNWKDYVNYIVFRPSDTYSETRYLVGNLLGFKITKSTYRVEKITFYDSPREIGNLTPRELQEKKTTIGALLLISSGPISLYEYTSNRGNRHYFVGERNAPLSYLPYNLYLKNSSDGNSSVQRSKEYSFKLNEILSANCPDLVTKISSVKYNRKSLVRLMDTYYDCIGFIPSYILEKSRPKLTFGIGPGMYYLAQTSETFGSRPVATDFEAPDGSGFSIGGFSRLYFNDNKVAALRGEIRYHQFSFKEKGSLPSSNIFIENFREHEFSEQYMVGKLGFELAVIPAKHAVNLSLGAAVNHALAWEEKRWIYSVRTDTGDRSGSPAIYNYEGETFIGPYAGLTMNIGQLGLILEATYFSRRLPGLQLRAVRVDLNTSYNF